MGRGGDGWEPPATSGDGDCSVRKRGRGRGGREGGREKKERRRLQPSERLLKEVPYLWVMRVD